MPLVVSGTGTIAVGRPAMQWLCVEAKLFKFDVPDDDSAPGAKLTVLIGAHRPVPNGLRKFRFARVLENR